MQNNNSIAIAIFNIGLYLIHKFVHLLLNISVSYTANKNSQKKYEVQIVYFLKIYIRWYKNWLTSTPDKACPVEEAKDFQVIHRRERQIATTGAKSLKILLLKNFEKLSVIRAYV